ncbi:MAG: FG-GAP-like repeat-containing protein [Pyrinomonadaceae bacterium]|nr:FG-GAP-like repeat-containing protein [Pyrinomonadaceae bacterium]
MNLLAFLTISLIGLLNSVFAAPGDLDPTFGVNGKVLTDIGSGVVRATDMLTQADGKIIVIGATGIDSPSTDFLLVRYNPDGTIDPTFDGDGIVKTDFNGKSDTALSAAFQADGKIVVVGYSGDLNVDRDFAIARYNSDGSLDTAFGNGGRLITDIGNPNDEAVSVAIAANGKIVVAGTTSSRNGDFATVRYLQNGSIDTSFGGTGIDIRDGFCPGNCSNSFDRVAGVAIDSVGRIIVIGDGRAFNSQDVSFVGMRYQESGLRDLSFGSTGKASISVPGNSAEGAKATGMILQTDGKIVVVGATRQSSTQPFRGMAISRFTANGLLDFDFNEFNRIIPNSTFNDTYQFNSVNIQSDGKIVAVGNFNSQFAVVRTLPDGLSDNFFGVNGLALTTINPAAGNGGAFGVGFAADGKIIVAGHQNSNQASEIAVARFTIDGCAYALSQSSLSFSRIGGERTINVTTSAGCFWTAVSNADWATIISGGSGTGNGVVKVSVGLNTTTQQRSTTLLIGGKTVNITQASGIGVPRRVKFDVDNDGRADIGIIRYVSNLEAIFYTLRSTSGFTYSELLFTQIANTATIKSAPADYDGDGTMDTGLWYSDAQNRGYFRINSQLILGDVQFGSAGDVPLPTDWDGDGRADLAVYRAGTVSSPQSYFYYRPSSVSNVNFIEVPWGMAGDKPVMGDFDGDGKTDAAVFRPSNGTWYVLKSSDGQLFASNFGISTDKPVAADYDGDGKTDVAVYRNGTWYIMQSLNGFYAVNFGISTDKPVPADYDGDGKADVTVFRDGTWYSLNSTNGFTVTQFGTASDTPTESLYLP